MNSDLKESTDLAKGMRGLIVESVEVEESYRGDCIKRITLVIGRKRIEISGGSLRGCSECAVDGDEDYVSVDIG